MLLTIKDLQNFLVLALIFKNPLSRNPRGYRPIFGSGVSQEPYNSLDPFFCCCCSSFTTNFESCDWLKRLIHLLSLVDNTEARLATADNTVQTADDMYTECTILFSLAQAHFAKQIISTQNTYGQILMLV